MMANQNFKILTKAYGKQEKSENIKLSIVNYLNEPLINNWENKEVKSLHVILCPRLTYNFQTRYF